MIHYILSMGCVSGDDIQVAIHRREDIFRWLAKLDHEGSAWTVTMHRFDDNNERIVETVDISAQIELELRNA